MDPRAFLTDLERKPTALAALADALRSADPWAEALASVGFAPASPPPRVVLLGMGSSAYAAEVAAARLRASGLVAVAELASSDLLPAWGEGTLVVPISASGGSRELLAAAGTLQERSPGAALVGLTNRPSSPLGAAVSTVVDLRAGPEAGGVACRSFQHTLILLLALEATLLGRPVNGVADLVEASATATVDLLDRRTEWLEEVTHLLDGPAGTHVVAPARRLASAKQSALMLREGPRRAAVGCEAGDWAHVDVYLTKNTDYRLLSYAGSAWDDGIAEWTAPRGTTVVSVGGGFGGAAATLRYAGDDVDDVRLVSETLVAELVAARLWSSSAGGAHR